MWDDKEITVGGVGRDWWLIDNCAKNITIFYNDRCYKYESRECLYTISAANSLNSMIVWLSPKPFSVSSGDLYGPRTIQDLDFCLILYYEFKVWEITAFLENFVESPIHWVTSKVLHYFLLCPRFKLNWTVISYF